MKPLDIYTLKRIIKQNYDNKSLSLLFNELGLDENKLRASGGLLEKAGLLVDYCVSNGKLTDLWNVINASKTNILEEYYIDETLFVSKEVFLKNPSLIPVPPEAIEERIIKQRVEGPDASALQEKIDNLLNKLIIFSSPDDQDRLFYKLEEASLILRTKWEENEYSTKMTRAEYLIQTTAREVYQLEKQRELRVGEENLNSERDEQVKRQEVILSWSIPVIMFFYVLLILLTVYIAWANNALESTVPLIQVPFPVFIWATIGSLCAILFRYYRRVKKTYFIQEIRYTVGRFWIGLIGGIIFYFAFRSGLFVLSNKELDINQSLEAQQQLVFVLVWIISFSDFIFERIITKISGNITGDGSEQAVQDIYNVRISDISDIVERASLKRFNEWRRLQAETGKQTEDKDST